MEGLQVICILPSLFISLPKPVWAKFGGWSEGGLVAIATSTAFLPSRRRRPQDSEQSHFAQTSAFESQPGAPQHSWVTLLFSPRLWQQRDVGEEEPPPVPHRQGGDGCKAGDGQHPQKNPASPILDQAPNSAATSVLLEDIFSMLEEDTGDSS